MQCDICGEPIPSKGAWTGGNNANPVVDGRCCDPCNDKVVVPERILRMQIHHHPMIKSVEWHPARRAGDD